jgi:hypothetical protein
MQDFWVTIKRLNLQIIGIGKEKGVQAKGTESIFKEKHIQLNNRKIPKSSKRYGRAGIGNFLDKKQIRTAKNFSKTYCIQNINYTYQERILKAEREKCQIIYVSKNIRITAYSQQKLQKQGGHGAKYFKY